MSSKPDITSMTKEEIVAYYEKLMAQQAQNQTSTILNLKKEISKERLEANEKLMAQSQQLDQKARELEIAKTDNKKLKVHNQNLKDLVQNLIDNIKEHQSTYSRYLQEENIPDVDLNDLHELNMYLESLMVTLFNAVTALIKHQERSLNLGTSEKNSGASFSSEDFSSDDMAKEMGKALLDGASETVTADNADTERKDFEEQSESVEVTGIRKDSTSENTGLTPDEVNNAILSGCSKNRQQDISSELACTSRMLSVQETENDEISLNKTRANDKKSSFVSVCDSEKIGGIITHSGRKVFTMHCTVCQKVMEFKLIAKKKRINSILTIQDSLSSLGSVLSSVQEAYCTGCDDKVEINPASFTDITLSALNDSDGQQRDDRETGDRQELNEVWTQKSASECVLTDKNDKELNTNETGNGLSLNQKKTTDRQKERKAEFRKIYNSESKTDTKVSLSDNMLTFDDGRQPVINPATFNAHVYGMTPAFIKSRLSVALLAVCSTQYSFLSAPKNRTYNFFEGNGFPMSKEHLIGAMNSFARAYLHPVTEYIRADIVKRSPAVIIDESTLNVRESASAKAKEGKSRKSQIWTLNSNWTSDFKASWYCVSDDRSFQNIIDILGDEAKDNKVLKYLISDGYAGYDAALKVLSDNGINIKGCRCFSHARRPLHYLLKEQGLLKIYNEQLLPAKAKFSDFEENLRKYRATKDGKRLSEKNVSLLTIYWMINALFVVDSAVVRKHCFVCNTAEFKADLMKERKAKSAKIVDSLFDSIRMFIAANPKIMNCTLTKNGDYRFTQNKLYPESRALIYLLKFEKDLRRFTESADIELTSNAAERSLKLGICTRNNCMFIHSVDGAHAFADYQTITNTCNQNRVPVQHYLIWLVANMKWRINKMIMEGHNNPTYFTMPGKQKKEGGDTLSMYDKENRYGHDKVDVSGLTPYDYRKYLEKSLGI